MAEPYIIKRKGQEQVYDERKVYASIYAAGLNAHLDKISAERIAENISRQVSGWLGSEPSTITSENIFRKVIELLKSENKDVSFMYETHRDLA